MCAMKKAAGAQDFDQRCALVAQRWAVLTRVILEIDEHVGSPAAEVAAAEVAVSEVCHSTLS